MLPTGVLSLAIRQLMSSSSHFSPSEDTAGMTSFEKRTMPSRTSLLVISPACIIRNMLPTPVFS